MKHMLENRFKNHVKVKKWLHEFSDRRQEVRNNCYAMINGKWNSDNQIEILKSVLL